MLIQHHVPLFKYLVTVLVNVLMPSHPHPALGNCLIVKMVSEQRLVKMYEAAYFANLIAVSHSI
jgi:hypothetical protein